MRSASGRQPLITHARLCVLLLALTACERDGVDVAARVPLPIAGSADISTAFSTRYSAHYRLSLEFAWPIEVPDMAVAVNKAAATVGSGTVPYVFDFEWTIVEGTQTIARGTSRDGFLGVIDVSDDGQGGGRLKTRALVFGEFDARRNGRYTLHLNAKGEFARLLVVNPALVVEHRPKT